MLVFWILFNLFVVAMLALDLGALNRRSHRVGFREALAWSGVWIALAAAFAVLVLFWQGRAQALQFVTGYVIELSLSVDNLFVFLVIFRYFKVPDEHQHKVLFCGNLRGAAHAGCVRPGGRGPDRPLQLDHLRIRRFARLFGIEAATQRRNGNSSREKPCSPPVPSSFSSDGRICGRTVLYAAIVRDRKSGLYATPLLVALLVVETSDILLAVDSIPAVLAITLNAFIVYTSNVFAILGLRSMYFALAGMMDLFHYLHYGLSVVLIFVGLKMLGSHYVYIPTEWVLAIVLFVLAASIVASLVNPQKKLAE